jgi:hypothetical protein
MTIQIDKGLSQELLLSFDYNKEYKYTKTKERKETSNSSKPGEGYKPT